MNQSALRFCLFGASPGTGNQGVNALCWSTLNGLAERGCLDVDVFAFGKGTCTRNFIGKTTNIKYRVHGIAAGKRFWRANHLWRLNMAAASGLRQNPIVRLVGASNAVLDASGGDSFTDLYGEARFRTIIAPKRLALNLGRPLILLPQTYGPFASRRNERLARNLVQFASLAYARDPESYAELKTLLGDEFDPFLHREGVDLAFDLPPREPKILELPVIDALHHHHRGQLLIGINVSGLVANRAEEAVVRFGLSCNYRELMRQMLMALLEETDARVILTPHVHAPAGHHEADLDASLALLNSLPERLRQTASERVTVITHKHDACELKWLIAQMDWFCGTRMHACIAALSSGVPSAALAYSPKTRGVFKSCGVADAVIDLRTSTVDDALGQLLQLWEQRIDFASRLKNKLPQVLARACLQLNDIVHHTRLLQDQSAQRINVV